jgi:hypothetical protein
MRLFWIERPQQRSGQTVHKAKHGTLRTGSGPYRG